MIKHWLISYVNQCIYSQWWYNCIMKIFSNLTSVILFTLLFPSASQAQKMPGKDAQPPMNGPLLETKTDKFLLNKKESTNKQLTPVNPFKDSSALYMESAEWKAAKGRPLQSVLQEWSDNAGWSLVWNSEYNYVLQANATFRGDYISAIKQLFDALGETNPPIYPELYQGNYVLQVGNKPGR